MTGGVTGVVSGDVDGWEARVDEVREHQTRQSKGNNLCGAYPAVGACFPVGSGGIADVAAGEDEEKRLQQGDDGSDQP